MFGHEELFSPGILSSSGMFYVGFWDTMHSRTGSRAGKGTKKDMVKMERWRLAI